MNRRRATNLRSVAVFLTLLALGIAPRPLAAEPGAATTWRSEAAAALPETGEIHLALFNNGARDGFMRLGWRKADGTIELYDRTMMPSGEVYESMRAELSAADLAPRSVEILFYQGPAILNIAAEFDGARVTGSRTVQQPQQGSRAQTLDLRAADVLFRGTSFILPLVLPDAGEPVSYDWYGALANDVATVSLTAVDGGRVETPAGNFDTIRYELRGGSPENDIYVTRGPERRVVRIDVLGMPLQFLAIPATAAEPATSAQDGATDTGSHETPVGQLPTVRLEPHADIAALQRLVGNWRLQTEFLVEGERVPGPDAYAEYRIGMNGLAVVKNGYHPSPNQPAPVFSSTTIYTWAPHENAVVAASNNSLGNRKTSTGQRTDDGFVFTQGGRLFGDRPGHNEIRLIIHSDDLYEIRQAHCPDDASPCVEGYWVTATRLPGGSAAGDDVTAR